MPGWWSAAGRPAWCALRLVFGAAVAVCVLGSGATLMAAAGGRLPAAVAQAASRAADAIIAEPGARTVQVAVGEDVLEVRTAPGEDVGRATNIKSASKSLVGALVGIAIAEGVLEGVEQPLVEVLPQEVGTAAPQRLQEIRIEHLLTMTAGLESTSFDNYGAWVASPNWLVAAVEQPVVAVPGEQFIYSTGNTHLLGAAVTEASGEPLPDFADRVLFGPLGIAARWDRDPQGYAFAGNNLAMSPRDLLRFGRLMAAGGVWAGRQLIPRSWIEASTRVHNDGWPERYGAYGYHWWLPPGEPRLWLAAGFGSQLLVIEPESSVVVVVTSTLESKGETWDRRVLERVRELARTVSSG